MKLLSTGFLAILFLVTAVSISSAENKTVTIEWQDLVPEGSTLTSVDKLAEWMAKEEENENEARGLSALKQQPQNTEPAPLVSKYNGKEIKIAGYMVPLDFESTSVNKFMLVPYIGACIHVPPPPGNQIILVESEKGVPVVDMNIPIFITGTLETGKFSTESAPEIGYQMKLREVSEYKLQE